MPTLFRAYLKTTSMSAIASLGESRLFLLNYLMRLLRVLLLFSLWRTVMTGRGTVSGFTLADTLTYTVIAEACAELLACRTWVESAFWDGSIATRFLRPMGVFGQFAAQMMGSAALGLVFFAAPLLALSPLLGVSPLPASLAAGLWFLPSLALAMSVGLALEYIFCGIAIWSQVHPYVLTSLRAALLSFISGAALPLALMPWNLGTALGWLPFAAQASAPLRIYTGTGEPLPLIASQVAWSVALWLCATRLWTRMQERMVSYGG